MSIHVPFAVTFLKDFLHHFVLAKLATSSIRVESFSVFLHHFVSAQLATSSIRVKGYVLTVTSSLEVRSGVSGD